jgi:hypothetical protein
MTVPTNQELVNRWRQEPAPLLPILHAFHERDGYLCEESLQSIAKGLRLPIADLFGTVTFYHHLARTPGGGRAPRVCTGPVCPLRLESPKNLRCPAPGAATNPFRCFEAIRSWWEPPGTGLPSAVLRSHHPTPAEPRSACSPPSASRIAGVSPDTAEPADTRHSGAQSRTWAPRWCSR